MELMYVNNSNKLDYRTRINIIKHYNYRWSKTKIAKKFSISRQAVYDIIRKYKLDDVYGLEDHKPGVLEIPLNPSFYANVISLRNNFDWGACRIEKYFNKKGFSVSHNKINKVIKYKGLTRKKMGKQEKSTKKTK